MADDIDNWEDIPHYELCDEVIRLRAELDAERALADRLASDLRRHLAWYSIMGVRRSLAAHEEARRLHEYPDLSADTTAGNYTGQGPTT